MKIVSGILLVLLLAGCSTSEPKKSEALAKRHCSTCHLFPDPSLLDKTSWENGVLPEMKFRMGLNTFRIKSIPFEDQAFVLQTLPSQSLVTEEEWKLIHQYYLENAPDTLVTRPHDTAPGAAPFRVREVKLPESGLPLITMIQYDSLQGNVYVGTRTNKIFRYDLTFKIKDSLQVDSPPSSIVYSPSGTHLISLIGIMDPNDQAKGSIAMINLEEQRTRRMIDSLQRPVHITEGELTGDGLPELLTCEFGNYTGSLTIYKKLSNGSYKRQVIDRSPGARRALIVDVDRDGLKDVVALFAQGDERIVFYKNNGNLDFSQKILLRFPPVYGSADFQLVDFNKDGQLDILLTAGDNADFSPIFKPYHGLRLFLNDGNYTFTESWFEPMHGAFRCLPYDFDNDGDLDLGAIAYFPNFANTPEHGFLYFEQTPHGFKRYTVPESANARWLVMELMDTNSDGKMDIVLGALDFPYGVPTDRYKFWQSKRTGVLILQNSIP